MHQEKYFPHFNNVVNPFHKSSIKLKEFYSKSWKIFQSHLQMEREQSKLLYKFQLYLLNNKELFVFLSPLVSQFKPPQQHHTKDSDRLPH